MIIDYLKREKLELKLIVIPYSIDKNLRILENKLVVRVKNLKKNNNWKTKKKI